MRPQGTVIAGQSQSGKTGIAHHLHNAWPSGYVYGPGTKGVPRISVFCNAKNVSYVEGPRARTVESIWQKVHRAKRASGSQRAFWRQPQWVPQGTGRIRTDDEGLAELCRQAMAFADRAGLEEGCEAWMQIIVDEAPAWDSDVLERVSAETKGKGIEVRFLCQHLKQGTGLDTAIRNNCGTTVLTYPKQPEGTTVKGYPWDEVVRWTTTERYGWVSYRPYVGWRRHRALPDPTA